MSEIRDRVESLEHAVKALAAREFGDSPGHPFRGNQYTNSGGDDGPYVPKGRTDEASYDYTDDPRSLATSFGKERLQVALDDAEPEDKYVVLKFDYEEHVPRQAVEEALQIAKGGGSLDVGPRITRDPYATDHTGRLTDPYKREAAARAQRLYGTDPSWYGQ